LIDSQYNFLWIKSEFDTGTIYFSHLAGYAHLIKPIKKGIIFVGENYIIGLMPNENESFNI
jgi:hypothetical protein